VFLKLLRHYQVWWSKRMNKHLKMEGDYQRQKMDDVAPVKRRLFIVSNLQYVERKHLHAALCSTGDRALAVASDLHSWLSAGGIATPVKPPGSSQGEGKDV
jgi:hypothetical protein